MNMFVKSIAMILWAVVSLFKEQVNIKFDTYDSTD